MITSSFTISAYGPANLYDLSDQVSEITEQSNILEGYGLVFSIGSTGSLIRLPSIKEVQEDFIHWVTKFIPFSANHRHPGNAFAHLRSTTLTTQIVSPVVNKGLISGEKSIVLLENTAGHKSRRIALSFIGEIGNLEKGGNNLKVYTEKISVSANGWIDLVNIESQVAKAVKDSGVAQGTVLVFTESGKTAVITMEAEMRLILDTADFIAEAVEPKIKPHQNRESKSYIASAFLGSDLLIPVFDGVLDLGTWQQPMLVDLGKPGKKNLLIQVIGKA